MANDYKYIKETGVIVVDTADLLTEVQDEFKDSFGFDLIVTPDTPQGVLITAETLAREAVVRNNAALANQINPNLAGGVFLDAILALTGVSRTAAKSSTVDVTLSGVQGTIVPAGVIVSTGAVDGEFILLNTVVIPTSGSVVGKFKSVIAGPIPASIGSLTQILSGVLGWETATNDTAAVLGTFEQSDLEARTYRRNTMALQGQSQAEAITSILYATEGVKSLSFRENPTNAADTIDGIDLDPHSIYVCVDGGTDEDVAAAILEKKSAGCGYNGGTSVDVVEPFSGQTFPVTFDRPTAVPVQTRITIRPNTSIADVLDAVKAAVLAYAAGDVVNEPGFTVGSDVSAFEIGGAVNVILPTVFVTNVEISLASPTSWTTTTIGIGLDEIATITSGAITVIIA